MTDQTQGTRKLGPAFLFGAAFVAIALFVSSRGITGDYSDVVQQPELTTVNLYSTITCHYCRKTRHYFRSNGIPFNEYDINNSMKGKTDFERLKGMGVPLVTIGGMRIDGYSPPHMERALSQAGYSL